MGALMLRRVVNTAMAVFWVSVPLLGMVLILPWLRIDWLQIALAVPGGASAALLFVAHLLPRLRIPCFAIERCR
jgi:hypothetical protein